MLVVKPAGQGGQAKCNYVDDGLELTEGLSPPTLIQNSKKFLQLALDLVLESKLLYNHNGDLHGLDITIYRPRAISATGSEVRVPNGDGPFTWVFVILMEFFKIF